jgi:hypothetical protein
MTDEEDDSVPVGDLSRVMPWQDVEIPGFRMTAMSAADYNGRPYRKSIDERALRRRQDIKHAAQKIGLWPLRPWQRAAMALLHAKRDVSVRISNFFFFGGGGGGGVGCSYINDAYVAKKKPPGVQAGIGE